MICILFGALGGMLSQIANIFFDKNGNPGNRPDFKGFAIYAAILFHGFCGALIVGAYYFADIPLNTIVSVNLGITSIVGIRGGFEIVKKDPDSKDIN